MPARYIICAVFVAAASTIVISPPCANIKSLVSILKKHKEKRTYLGAQTMPDASFVPVFVAATPSRCHKPYLCLKTWIKPK
jgi:hypothetical protein